MNTISDLAALAGLTQRSLVQHGDRRAVTLRREYDHAADDLWSAWTDPARLARWLGEMRGPDHITVGTTVELGMTPSEGDTATITILACEAPRRLTVRWAWPGEDDSLVDLRIEPLAAGRSALTLEHVALVDDTVVSYGAGWEDFLVRAGMLLAGEDPASLADDAVMPSFASQWRALVPTVSDERWPVVEDRFDDALLHVSRTFPTPIDEVWAVLVEPEAISRWFGRIDGDVGVGASFAVTFDNGAATGSVTSCAPTSGFVITWQWAHQDTPTTVSVDLATTADGTRVTVQQTGVVGPALGYAAGWSAYLAALERDLAGTAASEAMWQADWELAMAMALRRPAAHDPS